MFDKLEKLFADLVNIVKTRVEKLESGFLSVKDDLAEARNEVAGLKAEIADMKKAAGDFSGFQAAVDALKGTPSDPAPQSETPASEPSVPASVNDLVALDVPEAHPAHIAAAVIAHDEAVAAGSTPDVAHADAVAAASQSGADPEVAVKIADSVAINPPSEAPPAAAPVI